MNMSPSTATAGDASPRIVKSVLIRPMWIAKSVAIKAIVQPRSIGARACSSSATDAAIALASGASSSPSSLTTVSSASLIECTGATAMFHAMPKILSAPASATPTAASHPCAKTRTRHTTPLPAAAHSASVRSRPAVLRTATRTYRTASAANQMAIANCSALAATNGALMRKSAIAMLMAALTVASRRALSVERLSPWRTSMPGGDGEKSADTRRRHFRTGERRDQRQNAQPERDERQRRGSRAPRDRRGLSRTRHGVVILTEFGAPRPGD